MLSQRTKMIFANAGIFIFLLMSWWFIGLFVSQAAINRDGDFFEDKVALLGGSRFNDWLPLIATAVFGLGWLIGFSIARSTWTILKQIGAVLLFLILIIGLVYIFDAWSDVNSFSVFRELVRTCTILCMFGFIAGNPIGVFQKMKMG